MSSKAWDIYASQLLPLGYGHPLWMPEPDLISGRQVLIGDVGWLNSGGFRPLFNSMKEEADIVNQEKKVPTDFQPFPAKKVSTRVSNMISQQMVCSRSINVKEAKANTAVWGAPGLSVGAGFEFRVSSDAGALVKLNPPGRAEEIESRLHIIEYMTTHFDSWLEFANASNSWGLNLRPEQIIFVCGTLKTTDWIVAAFQGSMFRNTEGRVAAQFGPYASVEFSFQDANVILPADHYRTCPPRLALRPNEHLLSFPGYSTPAGASSGSSLPPDQCLFIHYYKMKRRMWWRPPIPMQASAGPDQLPPDPDKSQGAAPIVVYEFEPEPEPYAFDDAYDPVSHLLDYILQNSQADIAIASDLDLVALFRGRTFPHDIAEAITQLSPYVELDKNGVGIISVEYDVVQNSPIQENTSYKHSIEHAAHGVGYPAMYSSINMDTASMQLTPMNPFAMPHNVANSPASDLCIHGGTTPPHYDVSTHNDDDDDEDMNDDEAENSGEVEGDDEDEDFTSEDKADEWDGYEHMAEEETMAGPSEKAEGKRLGWGAPTRIHKGSVTALAYSVDGKYIASGSEDATVIIWDAASIVAQQRLVLQQNNHGHTDTIHALTFSHDNIYLASGSYDQEIIIWVAANGEEHSRISPGLAIYSLAYTPDGKYLVGGAADGTLRLWNAETYETVRTLRKHTAIVTFIIFSDDGRLMATGGTDSVSHIWETANLLSGAPLSILDGHRGMVCAAAFSPDNKRIITASDDNSSRIWNALTGEVLVILHEHTGPVRTVAFSPDGNRVASGSTDSTVKVSDSYTGEQHLSLEGHGGKVNMVKFSPDGRYIASAATDHTVRLWNASDGTHEATYNEHNDNVTFMLFAPDSSTLVSGSHDGTVFIRPLI